MPPQEVPPSLGAESFLTNAFSCAPDKEAAHFTGLTTPSSLLRETSAPRFSRIIFDCTWSALSFSKKLLLSSSRRPQLCLRCPFYHGASLGLSARPPPFSPSRIARPLTQWIVVFLTRIRTPSSRDFTRRFPPFFTNHPPVPTFYKQVSRFLTSLSFLKTPSG